MITLVPVAALVIAQARPAVASVESRLQNSIDVLDSFMDDPQQRIPERILRRAKGIAIIPGVTSAGFIFGGTRGAGILTLKQESGQWSNPAFVTLTGGSVGLQIGARTTDLILLFMNERSVRAALNRSFDLGGDVGVAAGPVGGNVVTPTDASGSDVLAYSRSAGLFAGVSLGGTKLAFDQDSSAQFYNQEDLTPQKILLDPSLSSPPLVASMRRSLNQAMK
ncbi:MAG: lipid-binding SYLF domain-containing protein [Gloeomargaritaceae cyanobacterium C42_A2020_066]|nr:lipid-binding SYLF domain-containing protein [Gloeomargaritaceae cyanobacterium C42_A2020_066]